MYKQKIKDVIDFCSWISLSVIIRQPWKWYIVIHVVVFCQVANPLWTNVTLGFKEVIFHSNERPKSYFFQFNHFHSLSHSLTLSVSCGVDSLLLSKFPLYYNYKPTRQKPATCAGAEQWLLVASLDWSRGITCNTWVNLCHALLQRALATSIYCLFFPPLCHVTNL